MLKKLIPALAVLFALLLSAIPAHAAVPTARITIRDINNVIKCQAVAPNTCTFNSLITGNFYTITLDEANGGLLSNVDLIGGRDATKWALNGYAVNYQGGTAPTCTYTATTTRWGVLCNMANNANLIQSVFLYGYPASSATDDSGRGIVRQSGINPSLVYVAYQTL